MSTINDRRALAAQEAATWLVRLNTEQLTLAERGQFIDWLRESPLHVAEMLRIGAVHDGLTEFAGWQNIAITDSAATALNRPEENPPQLTEYLPRRWRQIGSSWKYLGVAASLAVLGIGIALFISNASQHIQTQHGEHREIKLADGSLLEVAPDSELHLRLGRTLRTVTLDRGEALFHVAKDPQRPFIVTAGQASVRAVGTAFSVNRASNTVVVTVAEGKVAVTTAGIIDPITRVASARSVSLTADQQVAVPSQGLPTEVRAINSKTELAWARGLLIFDDDTIAEVVQRFNLSNRVQIRILDQQLAARKISGVFDAADPQSFLAFLANVAEAPVVKSSTDEILVGVSNSENSANNDAAVVVTH